MKNKISFKLFLVLVISFVLILSFNINNVYADEENEGKLSLNINADNYYSLREEYSEEIKEFHEEGIMDKYPEKNGLTSGVIDTSLRELLIQGTTNREIKYLIYIGDYGIPYQYWEAFLLEICEIDEIFNIDYINTVYYDNGILTFFEPNYFLTENQTINAKNIINQKVNSFKSGIKSEWCDLEKTIYLHDYLLKTIRYTDDSYIDESFAHSIYGALVLGDCVCDGYSKSFRYLSKQIGLSVDRVTSNYRDHAWNMVYINGKWYHLDCTWDDPTEGSEYCHGYYQYFLKSDTTFMNDGHGANDWIRSYSANSSLFENAFWKNSKNYLIYKSNYWYYADESTFDWNFVNIRKVYLRNNSIGSNSLVKKFTFNNHLEWDRNGITSDDNYLYLMDGRYIYKTDFSGNLIEIKMDIRDCAFLSSNYVLYGIEYRDGELLFDSTIIDNYSSIQTNPYVYITRIEFKKSSYRGRIGNAVKIEPVFYPENNTQNKTLNWSSGSTNIAEVNSTGYVTGKKAGTVLITAITTNGVQNSCPFLVYEYSISYMVQIKNEGWHSIVYDGAIAMRNTSGNLQQAMRINIDTPYSGGIEYNVHIENVGWQGYKSATQVAGIENTSLRTEALRIRLTGTVKNYYDVYYRVHVQNLGWMSWAKNDEPAGSSGAGWRIEGIQIKLVKKGTGEPSYNEYPPDKSYPFHEVVNVIYMGHIENKGDVGTNYLIRNGKVLGFPDQRLRVEGITVLSESTTPGSIEYTTHVEKAGWLDEVDGRWSTSGEFSGRKGYGLRVEGIKIRLTGELANKFNVFYCVKVENQDGWQGWAKNGEEAGSMDFGYKLEAVRIVILPKGDPNEGNYKPIPNPMLKRDVYNR